MFGGIVALEKQLIKVRSEASDTRLDIEDINQSIDVLPALGSVSYKKYYLQNRETNL